MDIKLLHLANHIHHVLFEEQVMIGGFYNWHLVFQQRNNFVTYTDSDVARRILEGEFTHILFGISRPELVANTPERVAQLIKEYGIPKEDFDKNPKLGDEITGKQIQSIPGWLGERKQKDLNIKIIGHVDYSIQLWCSPMLKEFFSPYALSRSLAPVDFIFTAEPIMGQWVHALTGRDVYFIQHPTNVTALKQMGDNDRYKQKDNVIRAMIHRYDNNWMAPFLVLETSFDKRNPDSPVPIYLAMEGSEQFMTELRSFGCEFVERGTPHSLWLDKLARTRIILDSYHNINNYGRTPVECACMRTPIIGSKVTYLQEVLFPELTTESNDILHQRDILNHLLKDQKFYNDCVEYAYKKVEMVGYDESKKKFEAMLSGELKPTWSKNV